MDVAAGRLGNYQGETQRRRDAIRLILIDATWRKTDMTGPAGRAPRGLTLASAVVRNPAGCIASDDPGKRFCRFRRLFK